MGIGRPKNKTMFSWNPEWGHHLNNIDEDMDFQLAIINPGDSLYV